MGSRRSVDGVVGIDLSFRNRSVSVRRIVTTSRRQAASPSLAKCVKGRSVLLRGVVDSDMRNASTNFFDIGGAQACALKSEVSKPWKLTDKIEGLSS